MMRVTFLGHSGFLVELPSVTLLFDYWKGGLPASRPGIPLLVFASHQHEDHFNPEIFSLNAAAFLLGKDITPHYLEKKGILPEALSKCIFLAGNETASPLSGITVETLPSTDEGVAFLVAADGQTIFHAGDLNWWHWEGEPDPWNPDMARTFRAYTEPLRGRTIDLALLPLDPRLRDHGFLGPKYILELADVRHFIPMHQWKKFSFTKQFLAQYPAFAEKTTPVLGPGQTFEF